MKAVHDITIVSVAGPGDEPYIRANLECIQAMNPGSRLNVVVIDNGKTGDNADGIRGSLDAVVLDGVPHDRTVPASCRGSYQHATALNRFLRTGSVNTRYLLILDPDFYIVRRDWIGDCLKRMQSKGWAFFGAPWHPRWFNKYRYFPCVHCMFIDTEKVDLTTLDFMPDLIGWATEKARLRQESLDAAAAASAAKVSPGSIPLGEIGWREIYREMNHLAVVALLREFNNQSLKLPLAFRILASFHLRSYRLRKAIDSRLKKRRKRRKQQSKRHLKIRKSFLTNRTFIRRSLDTGYRVYNMYRDSKTAPSGLLQPVFRQESLIQALIHLEVPLLRRCEHLLPDAMCYYPKRKGYATRDGFQAHGLPDVTKHDWEEFMLDGVPFGFHLRRFNKGPRNIAEEQAVLRDVLAHCDVRDAGPAKAA